MASEETVTLTRTEYDALISRNDEFEDRLAALDANDGTRVPHEVAVAIIRGQRPILAFRNHRGLTCVNSRTRPELPRAICRRSSVDTRTAQRLPWPKSQVLLAQRLTA